MGSLQETEQLTDQPDAEIVEVEQSAPEPVADEDPKESVRETVAKEYAKLKAESQGDGGEGEKAEGEKVDPEADSAEVAKPGKADDLEIDPDMLPPERFSARSKQMFNHLPKGIRRELHKTVRDLEALTSREKQELRQQLQQNRSVFDTIEPYAHKWGMAGIPFAQGFTQLAAAHERLTHPDVTTRAQTFLQLMSDAELDLQTLAALQRGGAQAQPRQPAQPPPEISQLREKVGSLESFLQRQQIEAAARPIIDELNSIKNEKDLSGRYRYPMLHEDPFVHSLKPLVSELMGTVPGITYGEAMKRAYVAMGGEVLGASHQPFQTRSPGQSNTQERARAAAASVRGRSSPGVVGNSSAEPPPEALVDARATARWALEQLRRG